MIIAQITDLHVRPAGSLAYGRVATNDLLAAAVRRLGALDPAPDCVLASGDLTDCGRPEEYALLAALLAPLRCPVYLIPGNHDRRDAMTACFRAQGHRYLPADGYAHFVIEDHPVRLIGLDTSVPGETGGLLCADRLDWLSARLEADPARPTVVFMHHPPFMTGITAADAIGCANGDALAVLVRRHPQIERVLCGHLHRPVTVRWAGTIGYVAPSTAHQVDFDLRAGAPSRFTLEPPAFAVHHWRPDLGIVTHQVAIEDVGPAYDFDLDPDYPGRLVAAPA